MSKKVYVIGVGMTKFERPLARDWQYYDMAREAGQKALKDAGVPYSDVEFAAAGYCYGDPTCGQRAVYELGLTGIPVVNVNNNCSTGSTALFLARKMVAGGANCVMALGFEKMERGLTQKYDDREPPTHRHFEQMFQQGASRTKLMPGNNDFTENIVKLFAYAAQEHMEKYGSKKDHFQAIAYKNHKHSVNNPNAQIQKEFDMDSIKNGKSIIEPITRFESCPTADGSACAIVCSHEYVVKNNLMDRAVEIAGQAMVTDLPSSFEGRSFRALAGAEMAEEAAKKVFAESGISPRDVDVLEVHDCFSANELMMYEAMGLCPRGDGGKLVETAKWKRNSKGGDLCYLGDRWVVNASGGLLSKGHPIGATGLGQCHELVTQLRGEAGKRQVEGAKVGLQHNFGIGGAAVVTAYRRPTPQSRL